MKIRDEEIIDIFKRLTQKTADKNQGYEIGSTGFTARFIYIDNVTTVLSLQDVKHKFSLIETFNDGWMIGPRKANIIEGNIKYWMERLGYIRIGKIDVDTVIRNYINNLPNNLRELIS